MRETARSEVLAIRGKIEYNCSNRIMRNGAVTSSAALTKSAEKGLNMATNDIIARISPASNPHLPEVEIYCDGAAIPNPGAGGIGIILVFGEVKKEISEPIGRASNQAAEIQAATTALMALNRPCHVTIYSDSQYLIKTMNGEYSRKANIELWNDLDFAALRHEVTWAWVRGHNGNALNERADKLANAAAKRNERGS